MATPTHSHPYMGIQDRTHDILFHDKSQLDQYTLLLLHHKTATLTKFLSLGDRAPTLFPDTLPYQISCGTVYSVAPEWQNPTNFARLQLQHLHSQVIVISTNTVIEKCDRLQNWGAPVPTPFTEQSKILHTNVDPWFKPLKFQISSRTVDSVTLGDKKPTFSTASVSYTHLTLPTKRIV